MRNVFFAKCLGAAALVMLAASPALADGNTDKPDGQVADEDIFGFDISMGKTNLTPLQLEAALNTCRERVGTDPNRYSGKAKAFCLEIQK